MPVTKDFMQNIFVFAARYLDHLEVFGGKVSQLHIGNKHLVRAGKVKPDVEPHKAFQLVDRGNRMRCRAPLPCLQKVLHVLI